MKMSYHCEVTRHERVQQIIQHIGMGQIIKEKYVGNFDSNTNMAQGKYICLTDTGITIIKSEDKQIIITIYVTTFRELVAVYGGQKNIPSFLKKKVDRNQSYYTKNGKTIWK